MEISTEKNNEVIRKSNMLEYVEDFFASLEVWEDINSGKNYKAKIYEAVLSFLRDCVVENATKIYESFFNAYWIGIQSGKNPFIDLIQKIKLFEEQAGILLPKQRDHYIHSVFVFLLGLAIYTKSKKFQSIFNKVVLENPIYQDAYSTKNEEFFYRWGISALFHDVAYPLEISIKQARKYLEFVSDYPVRSGEQTELIVEINNFSKFTCLPCIAPMPDFSDKFMKDYPGYKSFALEDSLDILTNRVSSSFGLGFTEVRESLVQLSARTSTIDHGIYGALIVLRWYYYLIEKTKWNPAYFYFPVADSASAILLHNYYKFHLMRPPFNLGPLKAHVHPISFLLIFCDELQEWNRVEYGEGEINHNGPIIDFEIAISDTSFKIIYCMDKPLGGDTNSKQKNLEGLLYVKDIFADGVNIKFM